MYLKLIKVPVILFTGTRIMFESLIGAPQMISQKELKN